MSTIKNPNCVRDKNKHFIKLWFENPWHIYYKTCTNWKRQRTKRRNEKKIIERNEPLTLRFICTMRLRQSQHTLPIEPTGNWWIMVASRIVWLALYLGETRKERCYNWNVTAHLSMGRSWCMVVVVVHLHLNIPRRTWQ